MKWNNAPTHIFREDEPMMQDRLVEFANAMKRTPPVVLSPKEMMERAIGLGIFFNVIVKEETNAQDE